MQLWHRLGGRQWIGNVEPPELGQARLDVGQLPSWQTRWPPTRRLRSGSLRIGQAVRVVFKPTAGGPAVPMFTPG